MMIGIRTIGTTIKDGKKRNGILKIGRTRVGKAGKETMVGASRTIRLRCPQDSTSRSLRSYVP